MAGRRKEHILIRYYLIMFALSMLFLIVSHDIFFVATAGVSIIIAGGTWLNKHKNDNPYAKEEGRE